MLTSRMVRGLAPPLLYIGAVASFIVCYNECVVAGLLPGVLTQLKMSVGGAAAGAGAAPGRTAAGGNCTSRLIRAAAALPRPRRATGPLASRRLPSPCCSCSGEAGGGAVGLPCHAGTRPRTSQHICCPPRAPPSPCAGPTPHTPGGWRLAGGLRAGRHVGRLLVWWPCPRASHRCLTPAPSTHTPPGGWMPARPGACCSTAPATSHARRAAAAGAAAAGGGETAPPLKHSTPATRSAPSHSAPSAPAAPGCRPQALTYFAPQDRPLLDVLCRWTVAYARCLRCHLVDDADLGAPGCVWERSTCGCGSGSVHGGGALAQAGRVRRCRAHRLPTRATRLPQPRSWARCCSRTRWRRCWRPSTSPPTASRWAAARWAERAGWPPHAAPLRRPGPAPRLPTPAVPAATAPARRCCPSA